MGRCYCCLSRSSVNVDAAASSIAVALVLFSMAVALPSYAEPLPSKSGIVNVRDYGASGDGQADDSDAIERAIEAAQFDPGPTLWSARIVYFPNGEYKITRTIASRAKGGSFRASLIMVGESRERTILRAADGVFPDATKPAALIFTSSRLVRGTATAGGKDYVGLGEGNDAYGNSISDMTIDVGDHNPGAIAIDYLANNLGALRHLKLVGRPGSGATGIAMQRKWPGPALVTDVRIEGFDVGVAISQSEYSITVDQLELVGQRRMPFSNRGNVVALRNVNVQTSGTAFENVAESGFLIFDGLHVRSDHPDQWIRNDGYVTIGRSRVESATKGWKADGLIGARDGAYFATKRLDRFSQRWQIPARSPPAAAQPALNQWVSVTSFGAQPDSEADSTDAIRKAMQSGAAVVYFPTGRYVVSASIEIPSHVARVAGMLSTLAVSTKRTPSFAREAGLLRVASEGAPLTIERLTFDNLNRGSQVGIEHAGARTLVVRDTISLGTSINRASTGGPLYLDDTSGSSQRYEGRAGVWARQLNSEGRGVRIVNAGAPFSLLGVKTEGDCTVLENLPGANSEVLGGLVYVVTAPSTRPAFVNSAGARLVTSYAESSYVNGANYNEHVVQRGRSITTTAEQLPPRGPFSRMIPGLSTGSVSRMRTVEEGAGKRELKR